MPKQPFLKRRAFTYLAIIVGMGSWSNILYPWTSKAMSLFTPIQGYILLISFWSTAVVGIWCLAYRKMCGWKATSRDIFSQEMDMTWFMLPMLCMSVQLIGNACSERAILLNLSWIELLLGMDTLLFAVGLLWFHWLSVPVIARIAQQSLTVAELQSFFILLLGTVGLTVWIILDYARILLLMGLVDNIQLFKLLACFFGGFGVWIVGFTFILWCYQKQKKMPIGEEWGIYIFSFQVYTIASCKIAEELFSPLTSGISFCLTILLTVLWLCFWKNRVGTFTS